MPNVCTVIVIICVTQSETSTAGILIEMYERSLPDDSTKFWACLRRAFPDALTNKQQYEACISNIAMVYIAGVRFAVHFRVHVSCR